MLSVGGAMILVFLLVEWRFAKLPIMPREFTPVSSCQEKNRFMPQRLAPSVEVVSCHFWTNVANDQVESPALQQR